MLGTVFCRNGVGKGSESIALALYNVISKVSYKPLYCTTVLNAPTVTMTIPRNMPFPDADNKQSHTNTRDSTLRLYSAPTSPVIAN